MVISSFIAEEPCHFEKTSKGNLFLTFVMSCVSCAIHRHLQAFTFWGSVSSSWAFFGRGIIAGKSEGFNWLCSILDDCLWRRYFQSHDFKDGARSKDLYITLSCQERDTRECAGLQHVTLGCLAGWVVVWQPVEHPTGSESSKGSSQHGRLHQKDQCWSW